MKEDTLGISSKECLMRGAMAVAALAYAAYSFYSSDFYVFGKHSAGQHFHGIAAWLLEGALLFAACALLAPVIGFYDKNQVKPDYEKFRRWFSIAGYALMGLGLSFHIFKPALGTSSAAWWILCGIVAAQLGRLPPSYAKRTSEHAKVNFNLPKSVSYLGAALVAVVALLFFTFSGFVAFHRPDTISPASGLQSLIVWIPSLLGGLFAAWSVSIVRRSLYVKHKAVNEGAEISPILPTHFPTTLSYLTAVILATIALFLFSFAGFNALKRPDLVLLSFGVESWLVWIPVFTGVIIFIWAVSIIRRTRLRLYGSQPLEKSTIKPIDLISGLSVLVITCIFGLPFIFAQPYKGQEDNQAILAKNKAEQAKYEESDALIRASSHDFSPPFASMQLQRSQADVLKELQAQQHKIKCYGDLRSNEKIQRNNDYLCWFIIKTAFGSVPARMATVFFSNGVLTNIRIEFPDTSLGQLHNYVKPALSDYSMQTLKELDWVGKQVIYWKTPTGTVTTSAATPKDQPLILLWSEK